MARQTVHATPGPCWTAVVHQTRGARQRWATLSSMPQLLRRRRCACTASRTTVPTLVAGARMAVELAGAQHLPHRWLLQVTLLPENAPAYGM